MKMVWKFLKRLLMACGAIFLGFIILCFIIGVRQSARTTETRPTAPTQEERLRAKVRSRTMAQIEAATQKAEVAARKAEAANQEVEAAIRKAKAKEQDDYLLFIRYSQKFVKERLKAPSTAKFPGEILELYEYKLQKLPDGSRRLFSWVDSQNGFGAMIRGKWMVEFKPTTNGWEAVDVIIE